MGLELSELLKEMKKHNASDMYLKAGSVPIVRVYGKLTNMDHEVFGTYRLSPQESANLAFSILNEDQHGKFEQRRELDLSYGLSGVGRFRINIFHQRNTIASVYRLIPFDLPGFEELHLPQGIKKLAELSRGLIVVTGATGSGKSTTLAAMIDYINGIKRKHIITIEDPIEFLFRDKESLIEQREVEMDTWSFSDALKHIVRQNPDIIMIGEMRDVLSLEAAINAAETGHLVLTTMHTINTAQTIERMINFFPPYQHAQIRLQLSIVLEGIIGMRLLSRAEISGRIPAVELLMATPLIKKLIEEGKTHQIPEFISTGKFYGMQTFNQSLENLYKQGLIGFEEAVAASSNPEEFRLTAKGIYAGTKRYEYKEGGEEEGAFRFT